MKKQKTAKIRNQPQHNQQSWQWLVVVMQRYGGWALWILSVLAAFYFAGNFVWNSFFNPGYGVADSGLFSGLLWHNDYRLLYAASTPLRLVGNINSFHKLHIALFFIPITYLSYLVPLQPEQWFALFMALPISVLVIVFTLAAEDFIKHHYPDMSGRKPASAAIGLILALNPMVLGILSFPHFEIWIIALLCAFLWSLTVGNKLASWIVLLLLLLVREDAGFHVCTVLGVIILWRLVYGIHKEKKSIKKLLIESRSLLLYFGLAFVYSTLAISILAIWGSPPLKPFSLDGWGNRLLVIATRVEWMYLFSVLLFFSALFRRWDWSLGLLSCLPWVLYNSTTNSVQSTLPLYYSFPLVVAVFWPLISHRLVPVTGVSFDPLQRETENWLHRLRYNSCYSICFLLIFTGVSIIRPLTPDIDSTPLLHFFYKGLLPPSQLTRNNTDAWMEFHRRYQDKTLTDRKMASIRPHLFDDQRILFHHQDFFTYCNADYVVLHAGSFSYNLRKLYAAINIFNLHRMYQLEGTAFFIFSKHDLCPGERCSANLALSETALSESMPQAASNKYRTRSMTFVGCAMRATAGTIEGYTRIVEAGAPAATLTLPEIPMSQGKYKIVLDYLYEGDGTPTLQMLSDDGNKKIRLPQNKQRKSLIIGTMEFSGAVTPMTIVITYPGQGRLQVNRIMLKP